MTTLLAYSPVEVPVIDDWTYAWSVEQFIETGELRTLEWSAHYPLTQILWGARFSHLWGFSFATLRVSSWVSASVGLRSLFLTLRELGITPVPASLGTLVLWCNPVFSVLSHSFTTDACFVSATNGALFLCVRWAKRGRTQDLSPGASRCSWRS
jgi:hypothetical protein